MTGAANAGSRQRRVILASLLAITCFFGARGITDESSVMLSGDMSRYVMNGVFMRDLIADGAVSSYDELERYAERYFAKYPALSLGHHPPLPSVALLPFFAVFGVSLFAARLAALCWFVLAAWGLYAFAKRLFDWRVASWATALFVTNLMVLRFGQYVFSEMPMLALVLWSLNALLLYCDTGKKRHFVWCVLLAVASLFAKQLAAVIFPVYGVILISRLGWGSLRSRKLLIALAAGLLFIALVVVITIVLAPSTMWLVSHSVSALFAGERKISMATILSTIISTHLSVPILIVVAAGTVALILRRDSRVLVPVTWLVAVIGAAVVISGQTEPARYSFGAMPAYFLLAAGLAAGAPPRQAQWVIAPVLAAAVLWQAWQVRDVHPSGAGGYEAAARYVLDNSKEPVILFDSAIDTGYFVFFVRKHDALRQRVVLRADKLLATPATRVSTDDQNLNPHMIYAALRTFGVRFIVVEERKRGLAALRLLDAELKTDRFIERQRIPIVSREPRAKGVDLVIYEFKDAQPADPDAEVDIDISRGNRQIKVALRDLIGGGR